MLSSAAFNRSSWLCFTVKYPVVPTPSEDALRMRHTRVLWKKDITTARALNSSEGCEHSPSHW